MNQVRKTTSDGSGRCTVSLLPPGPYVVTAAAPGWTPAVHEVLVKLGGSTTATLTMSVDGIAEDVEVTAGLAPPTGAAKSVLTALQLQNLPAGRRRIHSMFQLTPGTRSNRSASAHRAHVR